MTLMPAHNSVRSITPYEQAPPTTNYAVIVLAVKNETRTSHPRIGLSLAKMNAERTNIVVACKSYNSAIAFFKSSKTGDKRYFAFKALPGYYTNGHSHPPPPLDGIAFNAEAGKLNYFGDFIIKDNPEFDPRPMPAAGSGEFLIEQQQDLEAAKLAVSKYASLKEWPITLATQEKIQPFTPGGILCTP